MKKLFKTTFFITLAFVLLFVAFIIVSAENNHSESIGIIGGADGPTAIFITGTIIFKNPVFVLLCFVTVLCIASAIGWLITRKSNV